jgi:hypothetical protein
MAMTDEQRNAVECDLEAGKAPALIAAEQGISTAHVYKVRQQLQVLRRKNGLEPLPNCSRSRKLLTDSGEAIRQEYLATGQIRPLARKHGLTVDVLRGLLERYPSVVFERQKRQQQLEQTQQ